MIQDGELEDVNILLFTGMEVELKEAQNCCGINDLLHKPCSKKEFIEKIKKYLIF